MIDPPATPAPGVVIVGGGIAGLAAAHRLSQLAPTFPITLIETAPRFGGKIVTERVDGFVVESGPDSFLAIKPRGVGLCEELGLDNRLQGTTPQPHRAYVMRDGRLLDLPAGLTGLVPARPRPIIRSGLISPRGKARLMLDFLLPPRRGVDDESLAAFIRRRLGREVYDRLVEPLMAGIYAGDGDQLSLAATFPQLRQAELAKGSLIRGVLATARHGSPLRSSGRFPFLAPIGGLGELVDTLVGTLTSRGVRLLPGTRAAKLVPLPSPKCGYRLELDDGDALDASAVILAVPAFAAAELVRELDTALSEQIQSISYASCAIVTLAFRALDVPRPLDAHGYIIPRIEGRPILASSWTSAKWAHRAPADFALLRLFFGRFGDDAMLAGSDAYLLALARGELRDTLGISVAPVLARINRWPRSMPQYTLGHLDRLSTITRRLAHRPGLYLAGAAYHGVGIPDCIGSGETAAEASFKDLRQPS